MGRRGRLVPNLAPRRPAPLFVDSDEGMANRMIQLIPLPGNSSVAAMPSFSHLPSSVARRALVSSFPDTAVSDMLGGPGGLR